MKSHIYLINQYAILPNGSGGTRHYNLAATLQKQGYDASLVMGSSELNTGKQSLKGFYLWRSSYVGPVQVVTIKTFPVVGNSIYRILGMISFSVILFLFLISHQLPKPKSIYFSSTPQPFACLAAYLASCIRRTFFVLEIRDLWPESLFSLGIMSSKSLIGQLLHHLDLYLVRKSSIVFTLLSNASKYYCNFGIEPSKFVYLPNGVDPISFNKQLSPASCSSEQDDGIFIFCYFGALGHANSVESIVEACYHLKRELGDTNFVFKIIGSGPRLPYIQDLINNLGLEGNIQLLPPIPKSEIYHATSTTNCFIFNLRPASVFQYGISPNKLLDYMAIGRPIIFCADNWPNPLEQAGTVIYAKPSNPQSIAIAMLEVMSYSQLKLNDLGATYRSYVLNHHSFDTLARTLATTLSL